MISNYKLLALMALGIFTKSHAIFYNVQQYVHDSTGQEVWAFSDVHLDIENMGPLTTLQQRALINAAKKKRAYMIVEDVEKFRVNGLSVRIDQILICSQLLNAFIRKRERSFWLTLAGFTSIFSGQVNEKIDQLFIWYRDYNVRLKDVKKAIADQHNCKELLPLSPLNYLESICKCKSIPCYNVEFRHFNTWFSVLRSNPNGLNFLDNVQYSLGNLFCFDYTDHYYPHTCRDIWNMNQAIIKEIDSYSHKNQFLANFYEKCIIDYNQEPIVYWLNTLNAENPQAKIQDILAFIPLVIQDNNFNYGTTEKEVYDNWRTHSSHLLDARIVHALVNQKKHKVVFICAGGWHIDNICPVLDQLGYSKVASWGKEDCPALYQEEGGPGVTSAVFADHVVDLESIFEPGQANA